MSTISKLKKKLDQVFSLYIRTKYADWRGNVKCVTCGCVKPIKEMQCGHFISRSCNVLRYSEENCFVQCCSCNVFKHGNYPAYSEFIVKTFGVERLYWLNSQKLQVKKFNTKELENLIEEFNLKLYEVGHRKSQS